MSESDVVRLGIVGCGRISFAHRSACFHLKEHVIVEAVADTDATRLSRFCEALPMLRQYTDYRSLLKDPTVDAVIICLPHSHHHPSAIEALLAGKHVLVEKPMALNYLQAVEMAEVADRVERVLMVGQCRRFSQPAREMKERIDRGDIGEVFRVLLNFLCFFEKAPTPWWNDKHQAGEPLVTILQGSHAFDEVSWLMGRVPESVYAISSKRTFPNDDEGDILLDYGNGVSAVHLSLNTPPPLIHEVLAIGTRGTLKLSESLGGEPFQFGYLLEMNGKRLMDGIQAPSNFTLQLQEFVSSIREKRQPIANGREVASTTMRVISAAVESAMSKQAVRL